MLRFSALWNNHPTNLGNQMPCRTNGAPNYSNQCAIRLGVCLKNAGVQRSDLRSPVCCSQHAQEEMHFLRAQELANALRGARIEGLGPVTVFTGDQARDFPNAIGGRKGIIYFKDYWFRVEDLLSGRPTGDHIDVWNGWRTSAKILLPWFGWLGGYDRSGEVWFWEVK